MKKLMTLTVGSLCALTMGVQGAYAAPTAPVQPPTVQEASEEVDYKARLNAARVRLALMDADFAACKAKAQSSGYYDAFESELSILESWLEQIHQTIAGCKEVLAYPPSEAVDREGMFSYMESLLFEAEGRMDVKEHIDEGIVELKEMDAAAELFCAYCTSLRQQMQDARPPQGCTESDVNLFVDAMEKFIAVIDGAPGSVNMRLQDCHEQINYGADISTVVAGFKAEIDANAESIGSAVAECRSTLNSIWFKGGVENAKIILTDELNDALTEASDFLQLFDEQMAEDLVYTGDNEIVQSQYDNFRETYSNRLLQVVARFETVGENIEIFSESTEFGTVEDVETVAGTVKNGLAVAHADFSMLKEEYAADIEALYNYRDTWQMVWAHEAQIAGLFAELQNLREGNASNAAFISECDEFKNECEVLEADNQWLGTDLTSNNYQLDEYTRNLYESRLQQLQNGIAQARVDLEDLQQMAEEEQGEIAELAAAKAELIECYKVAMARVAEMRSEIEGELTIPSNLYNTTVGNRLEDLRPVILAALDNDVTAPLQALYEELRQDIANQTLDTVEKCEVYKARLNKQNIAATETLSSYDQQWQQLSSMGQKMADTKSNLNALQVEIQAALAELEGMLRVGNLPPKLTDILGYTLTDYRALLDEVNKALDSVDALDYDLGNSEYITDELTVTLNGLRDQAADLRSRFGQAREEYHDSMETLGFNVQFNANTFFAKVSAISDSMGHFILYLNDNLTDEENFSDHYVFTQGNVTPNSPLYGLFWHFNNEAQRFYGENYYYPVHDIEIACQQAALDGTLSERADEFLAQLYRLQYEASVYADNWRNQLDQYGEIPWMIPDLKMRIEVLQSRITNYEVYLNGLTIPESDSQEYVQRIVENTAAEMVRFEEEVAAVQSLLNDSPSLDTYDEIDKQLGKIEEALDACMQHFSNSFANMPDAAPVADINTLYAACVEVETAISEFLYDLNNVLLPPAGCEGSYIFSAMMSYNNQAQADMKAMEEALAKERALIAEAADKGELNVYAVDGLDEINSKMSELTSYQQSFNSNWNSLAADANRYIALRQSVDDLSKDCAAHKQELALYAEQAAGNAELTALCEEYAMRFAAIENNLGTLTYDVLYMEIISDLEELEQRVEEQRAELARALDGFNTAWAEQGGTLPENVTNALLAEFNTLINQACMLDAESRALIAQISDGFDNISFWDEVSEGFVGRLNELVTARDAVATRQADAMEAGVMDQAAGTFTESNVIEMRAVITDYTMLQSACERLLAEFQAFGRLFTAYRQCIAAASAESIEVTNFGQSTTTDAYDNDIEATLAKIAELTEGVNESFTSLQIDWNAGAFEHKTLNDYEYCFAEPKAQLGVIMQQFWQKVKPAGVITISSLEAEYEMTVEYQIASKTETYREYDENFDFDVVKRCELYQSIVALFNARFSEDHKTLMTIDHAIRDCEENADLLLLEGEDIMARLAAVRAEADAFRADFLAAMEQYADELAAEYALRSGAVTDTATDDVVFYVDTYVVNAGDNVEVPIKLKTNVAIKGFQFDMALPEGIVLPGSVPQNVITYTTTERSESAVFQTNYKADANDFRVVGVMDSSDAVIAAGDGAVVNLKITNVPEGNYPLVFRNVKIVGANNEFITIDKVIGNVRAVTLADFGGESSTGTDIISDLATALGTNASDADTVDQNDITGDGEVTIGDITTAIRLLNEKQ